MASAKAVGTRRSLQRALVAHSTDMRHARLPTLSDTDKNLAQNRDSFRKLMEHIRGLCAIWRAEAELALPAKSAWGPGVVKKSPPGRSRVRRVGSSRRVIGKHQ